ncbi:class I SAM-dependent methyltransferase [Raineya orbicola]|jgi:SAM-dependent methyltransferase|uniref:Methyltransferase domain n=1 Tax=Raineya orbicola TaxID=2016530 RepID=A0A2N3IIT6_9BACT|nr:class I SAM-dependent methyltransferase [Raineya orbicola]PKQ70224.1 Methyltransferase domain [Raineya orbicola]
MAWYKEWFDSPYYHILYKNRDEQEAQICLTNMFNLVPIVKGSKILDIPCGRGRHAAYLAKNGYQVTGVDLSLESIAYAKENYQGLSNLEFFVHDMRVPFREGYYDYVLNFFTSFGYFETETENVACLQALAKNLKKEGTLILDFFNTERVLKELVQKEEVKVEGISFYIERELQGKFLVKTIRFTDKGQDYCFQERVMAISPEEFRNYFKQAGLRPLRVFGNYFLEPYDEFMPRVIWVLVKE